MKILVIGKARHTLNQNQQAGIILGWNPEINLIDYLKTVIK
jgi:hypothetical protein